jgi:hypothetical protein
MTLIVFATDDINVKVIAAENSLLVGKFILLPNSVRKDVPFIMDVGKDLKIRNKKWEGQDIVGEKA